MSQSSNRIRKCIVLWTRANGVQVVLSCHHCLQLSTMLPMHLLLLSNGVKVICASSRYHGYVDAQSRLQYNSNMLLSFAKI
jgi:hypothetical protein